MTAQALLRAHEDYRLARRRYLELLGCAGSNRDPLAELSERLVAAILDGTPADSRVQKGFDVVDAQGARVQVKYVANPRGLWVNGHVVDFRGDIDRYAVVLVEDLAPTLVLIFTRATIGRVCRLLQKRHPDQDSTLQLTRANVDLLRDNAHIVAQLGVQIIPVGV